MHDGERTTAVYLNLPEVSELELGVDWLLRMLPHGGQRLIGRAYGEAGQLAAWQAQLAAAQLQPVAADAQLQPVLDAVADLQQFPQISEIWLVGATAAWQPLARQLRAQGRLVTAIGSDWQAGWSDRSVVTARVSRPDGPTTQLDSLRTAAVTDEDPWQRLERLELALVDELRRATAEDAAAADAVAAAARERLTQLQAELTECRQALQAQLTVQQQQIDDEQSGLDVLQQWTDRLQTESAAVLADRWTAELRERLAAAEAEWTAAAQRVLRADGCLLTAARLLGDGSMSAAVVAAEDGVGGLPAPEPATAPLTALPLPAERTDGGAQALDARLTQLEQRLDARMAGLEQALAERTAQLERAVDGRSAAIEQGLAEWTAQFDRLKADHAAQLDALLSKRATGLAAQLTAAEQSAQARIDQLQVIVVQETRLQQTVVDLQRSLAGIVARTTEQLPAAGAATGGVIAAEPVDAVRSVTAEVPAAVVTFEAPTTVETQAPAAVEVPTSIEPQPPAEPATPAELESLAQHFNGNAAAKPKAGLRSMILPTKLAPIARPATKAAAPKTPAGEFEQLAADCADHALAIRHRVLRERGIVLDPTDEGYLHDDAFLAFYGWAGHYQVLDEEREFWRRAAGSFEAAAAAARGMSVVLERLPNHKVHLETGLKLVAETQSALRALTMERRQDYFPTQLALYKLVKELAGARKLFLERHLRQEDLADAAEWKERRLRARSWAAGVEDLAERPQLIKRFTTLLERAKTANDVDWQELDEIASRLKQPVLNDRHRRELQQLLRKQAGLVRGNLRRNRHLAHLIRLLQLNLNAGEELDARETAAGMSYGDDTTRIAEDDAQLNAVELVDAADEIDEYTQAARELLRGQVIVLIGGESRPEAEEKLRSVFEPRELIWVHTVGSSRFEIEHLIARDDVRAVFLAIRWVSHAVADKTVAWCRKYGRPLVRLTTGYNVGTVAHRLVTQVSGRIADNS
jgi:hypothetical protein